MTSKVKRGRETGVIGGYKPGGMTDPWLERVARNEAAFRRLNERLRQTTRLAGIDHRHPFSCECGVIGCSTILELTVPEYEAVRAEPRRFLVAEGHAIPEAEDVVLRTERYTVVEKREEAAAVAEETDPRAER